MHGTRSIQKIIEVLKFEEHKIQLSDYLIKDFIPLTHDINGNHVIQKILSTWSPQDKQFIYNHLEKNVIEIACHKHGCCIMQKSIDAADKTQK